MKPRLAKRLVEPDFWTCPHGVRTRPESVLTYGPEVADINAAAGFAPDPQQELGLDLIFGIRPDGSPASFSFCVICCRQNLKTGLFKQAAVGWIYVIEVPLVVWSAHEMSTTNEAQRDLANLILGSPMLRKRLMAGPNDGIYYANGEERIEFASSQRIMFKARTKDGGRGLAAPRLILDEAFALKPAMMGALLPTMTAMPDAQVLYGSSAGKADSEVLFDIRERGRKGSSPRMSYIEWLSEREPCADPECTHPKDALDRGIDCALDREHLILKANPTISTGRITVERIRDLRQELPAKEFMRECLGWWEEPGTTATIDGTQWAHLVTARPPAPPAALGLAVDVDRVWASIGASTKEQPQHLGSVRRGRLGPWVVEEVARICRERGIPVAIDAGGPAANLIPELEQRGVRVVKAAFGDYVQACADLYDAINLGIVEHGNYDDLNQAVSDVIWRVAGDRRAWGRKSGDISMLEAVTLARWAALRQSMQPFSL